ncbi:hypothetical protein F4777DRAFT_123329 [Nemania sp. FL0916]|nr:hypothetical protein F4777DRAFT_123329 [Nemania sp. FL0916]
MRASKQLLVSALAASFSTAHVVLENPKPYKFVEYGPTNPISPTGSNFPCKIPPGQSYIVDSEPTQMTIGEDQKVSFSGQAVHGGGSCQLALTRGLPDKTSSWMVIHSIEGGCPARNQKGNLDGPNHDDYTFQIPEGIEPGANWTLAWTWVARIGGQPEFYMNCAPISILPSSKKRMSPPERRDIMTSRAATSFPELFMANMGGLAGGCTTDDARNQQVPIAFPDPGTSVDRPEGDHLFVQPCDGNPRARNAAGGAGNGGQSTSQTPPASSSLSSSVAGAPTSVPASNTSQSSTSIASSTTTSSPSQSAAPSGHCTEGYLTCLSDGTHFATCTGGQLTGPQPIAPGYKCQPGEGQGLDISPM